MNPSMRRYHVAATYNPYRSDVYDTYKFTELESNGLSNCRCVVHNESSLHPRVIINAEVSQGSSKVSLTALKPKTPLIPLFIVGK